MKYSFDWSDVINPDRTELVFEGRNKEYGGYVIRREYQRRIVIALIVSCAVILALFVTPMVISYLSSMKGVTKTALNDEAITLMDVAPIDKIAPPPPAEPPPPVQKTIKFTPPVVVKDEEVEEPPPTQEETKETQVSTVTQEGENIIDLPPDPVADPDEGKIFTVVEEMPSFPGGESKMIQFIHDNTKYPTIARENNIQGRVYVSFIVDKEGKITEVTVLRGVGGGLDEEAVRVVKSMPSWNPGRQNGRNVTVRFNLPVNFTMK